MSKQAMTTSATGNATLSFVDAELNDEILETPPKNVVEMPHEEAEEIMDTVELFEANE